MNRFLVLSSRSDGNELLQKMAPLLIDGMATFNKHLIELDPSQQAWVQKQQEMGKIMAQQFVDNVTDQLIGIPKGRH